MPEMQEVFTNLLVKSPTDAISRYTFYAYSIDDVVEELQFSSDQVSHSDFILCNHHKVCAHWNLLAHTFKIIILSAIANKASNGTLKYSNMKWL